MMSVGEFFDDQCLFITGGTGFLGKVLVEKLLRSCPGINKIYLLVRSRGLQAPRQRLRDLIDSEVFNFIKSENSSLLGKLVPICGNITADGLGLSDESFRELKQNVSIVVHSAATIRFDEPINRAIELNVKGTYRVLQLCQKLDNIKCMVHVSTAYCATEKKNIPELCCDERLNVLQYLQSTKWFNSDLFSSSSTHLLGGRPTSYHYTKALAETMLNQEYKNVPIAIVRPSIITASWREPFPGWIDNFNGPSGYLVSSGKGVLRTMYGHKDKICDMVPVDVVSNTIITAAWSVGTSKYVQTPVVYNCTSGSLNPITWGQMQKISSPLLVKHPSTQIFRFPNAEFHSNRLIHELIVLVEHNIPAFLVDLLFKALGHKPILSMVYTKVHRAINALEYFTINEWTYKADNFVGLMRSLNEDDQKIFYINIGDISWFDYMENYVLGVRRFLLREDPSTLPEARIRLKRLYFATQIIKLGVFFTLTHQLARRKSTLRTFLSTFRKFALRS
ncbi:putative fatty acyl-CoA reductase CG5065 [Brevipalpus obovatus]|uniref:putative fatty acyl-CoA reductase CG5065 n=1 Tax=Brevipalpus obovatus TaxID=246614 RepID=UPI003D9DF5BD